MADSKRGSKTFALALKTKIPGVVYKRPWEMDNKYLSKRKRGKDPRKWGWFCFVPGSWLTHGFGLTRDEAFVDYVEEGWCLGGEFPKGYPN